MSGIIFDGQGRRRRAVNLGGGGGAVASSSSSSSSSAAASSAILARAQADRQAREEARRRWYAAQRIQAVWRGQRAREAWRTVLQDALEAMLDQEATWDSTTVERAQALQLLLDRLGGGAGGRGPAGATVDRLLVELVKNLLGQGHDIIWTAGAPSAEWRTRQRRFFGLLLRRIKTVVASDVAPLASLAQHMLLVKTDPVLFTPSEALLLSVADTAQSRILASLDPKTDTALLPCIQLVTTLFKGNASEAQKVLSQHLVRTLWVIPYLPNRLPIPALQALALGLPHSKLIMASTEIINQLPRVDSRTSFLANFLAFELVRIQSMDDETLSAFLHTTALLVRSLPASVWQDAHPPEGLAKKARLAESTNDERVETADSYRPPAKVAKQLASLFLTANLESILRASRKYVGHAKFKLSSLSALLVALLRATPVDDPRHESILHVCLYSAGGGSATTARGPAGTTTASGALLNGSTLLREIWRASLRSSPLIRKAGGAVGKSLAFASSTISIDELVKDRRFYDDWISLELLVELYSRLLLTMGDDEFFGHVEGTGAGSTSGRLIYAPSTRMQSSRNPLSIDELVELTSLVRNLTFAIYWDEAKLTMSTALAATLGSMNKFLGLIHDRDSRRAFTLPGYWEMVGVDEIPKFVSAVLHDEQMLLDRMLHGGPGGQDETLESPSASARPARTAARQNLDALY